MQRAIPAAAAACLLGASSLAQHAHPDPSRPLALPEGWCQTLSRDEWRGALKKSIEAGNAVLPDLRNIPAAPQKPDRSPFLYGRVPCVTTDQIHVFEDDAVDDSLDLGSVFVMMTRAANDVIAKHGDVFDFFAFFANICPSWGFGAAFYLPIFNQVEGLGDPSGIGTPIFDDRANLGLNSQRALGYIMMHGIDAGFWAPGDDITATTTRLVLAHEFGHRWICFLPPLADGRHMEGGANCAFPGHWNFQVDNQASCLYLHEYVGSNPAVVDSTFGSILDFNRDTKGAFSMMELYLMGFATPGEMDATELRYMDEACGELEYDGPISSFTSADVIATSGPRVPDMAGAPKHHRAAWIMLHPPGNPPEQRQLDDMAGIMQQQMLDWNTYTLGRGTLDVTLFDQCTDIQSYGCINPVGSLQIASGRPRIGDSLTFEMDNPFGTQAAGAIPVLAASLGPDPHSPCGTQHPNLGMNGPGEVLIDLTAGQRMRMTVMGSPWMGTGQPAPVTLDIPPIASLVGLELFVQGALVEALPGSGVKIGMTDAIRIVLGP